MVAVDSGYRLDLSKLSDCLTSRTKLVAITAISNVLGTINQCARSPMRPIASGVWCWSMLSGVPHGPLSVEQLAADFLVFSGHKMLGPSGIGVFMGESLCSSRCADDGGGG